MSALDAFDPQLGLRSGAKDASREEQQRARDWKSALRHPAHGQCLPKCKAAPRAVILPSCSFTSIPLSSPPRSQQRLSALGSILNHSIFPTFPIHSSQELPRILSKWSANIPILLFSTPPSSFLSLASPLRKRFGDAMSE